ncbi:hypothetical protein [Streptomyces mirabilis]|uniref:hypothetical protein n=1 Tax=Streptomyces mirabilis TaxID=68239 RepID=UPI0033B16BE1
MELALTVGRGLVVREAATAEYVLHGIHIHLAGVTKAYAAVAIATAWKAELAAIDEILPHGGFGARDAEGHVPAWI